jgi:hypothetical protein
MPTSEGAQTPLRHRQRADPERAVLVWAEPGLVHVGVLLGVVYGGRAQKMILQLDAINPS